MGRQAIVPILWTTALLLVIAVPLTSALTEYKEVTDPERSSLFPDPESCQLLGDAGLYGLGVRLGYYLLWLSSIISIATSLEKATAAIFGSNLITLAVFISSFVSLGQHPTTNVVAVEWFIIINLTLVLQVVMSRAMLIIVKRDLGQLTLTRLLLASIGFQWLLVAWMACANLWLYFGHVGDSLRKGCDDPKVVLFARTQVTNSGFQTFNKVWWIIILMELLVTSIDSIPLLKAVWMYRTVLTKRRKNLDDVAEEEELSRLESMNNATGLMTKTKFEIQPHTPSRTENGGEEVHKSTYIPGFGGSSIVRHITGYRIGAIPLLIWLFHRVGKLPFIQRLRERSTLATRLKAGSHAVDRLVSKAIGRKSLVAPVFFLFLAFAIGSAPITFVEFTISVNHLEFKDFDFAASDQLVPFLIGVFSLFNAIFL